MRVVVVVVVVVVVFVSFVVFFRCFSIIVCALMCVLDPFRGNEWRKNRNILVHKNTLLKRLGTNTHTHEREREREHCDDH